MYSYFSFCLSFPIYPPVSPPAPRQSFKDAAIAAANKKKNYSNPPPSSRAEEPGTPPPDIIEERPPSPYLKPAPKRKAPPAKDYEQAFTVDDDVRIVPPKTKSQHVKNKPSDVSSSSVPSIPESGPELTPPVPPTVASSRKSFKKFIFTQPSIIQHPISSLDLPDFFSGSPSYAPPEYQTDIFKYPFNSQILSLFMDGEQVPSRNRSMYDADAVENTLGYIFHLVTHFFHGRPHACVTEVADRAALFTEMNVCMRTLFSCKEDPNIR